MEEKTNKFVNSFVKDFFTSVNRSPIIRQYFTRDSIIRDNGVESTGDHIFQALKAMAHVYHQSDSAVGRVQLYSNERFAISTTKTVVHDSNGRKERVGYIFVIRKKDDGNFYFKQFWRNSQHITHKDTIGRWLKNESVIIARRERHNMQPFVKLPAISQGTDQVAVASASEFQSLRVHSAIERYTGEVSIDIGKVGVWDGKSRGNDGEKLYTMKAGRVSLQGKSGREKQCLADIYIRPDAPQNHWLIDDKYSGLDHFKVNNGVTLERAHEIVNEICEGKMLIGKDLATDLTVFEYDHPHHLRFDIDTVYTTNNGEAISLKLLVQKIWNVTIQEKTHDSIIAARYKHKLYCLYKDWPRFSDLFLSIRNEF